MPIQITGITYDVELEDIPTLPSDHQVFQVIAKRLTEDRSVALEYLLEMYKNSHISDKQREAIETVFDRTFFNESDTQDKIKILETGYAFDEEALNRLVENSGTWNKASTIIAFWYHGLISDDEVIQYITEARFGVYVTEMLIWERSETDQIPHVRSKDAEKNFENMLLHMWEHQERYRNAVIAAVHARHTKANPEVAGLAKELNVEQYKLPRIMKVLVNALENRTLPNDLGYEKLALMVVEGNEAKKFYDSLLDTDLPKVRRALARNSFVPTEIHWRMLVENERSWQLKNYIAQSTIDVELLQHLHMYTKPDSTLRGLIENNPHYQE